VAALGTDDAAAFARMAAEMGCGGLMVLPPYVYSSDWREMKHHVSAVISATKLPCMLYNNPIAYKTDFLPEMVAELAAEHPNLVAIKESSADIRRIAAIRALLGDRIHILVGVDDLIVEAIAAGATGWIAGLVNAYPRESVVLFDMAKAGKWKEVEPLYHWFLPLLRLDVVVKFVQLIKLVQEHTGMGSSGCARRACNWRGRTRRGGAHHQARDRHQAALSRIAIRGISCRVRGVASMADDAPDAIVIGAGVIGLACASRLVREGRRCCLLDRASRRNGRLVRQRRPHRHRTGFPAALAGSRARRHALLCSTARARCASGLRICSRYCPGCCASLGGAQERLRTRDVRALCSMLAIRARRLDQRLARAGTAH
jgi:glycine/D-amino acid oxidase-like deaminating enzyme